MAITGKVARSDMDMRRIREFVERYQIHDIDIKVREIPSMQPYNFNYDYYSNYRHDELNPYVKYTHVNMYTMTMPEGSFENITDRISEIDELMRDPETAELVQKARFIYRLRYGPTK